MAYKNLLSLFHQNELEWENMYQTLFHFPLSRHIDIKIKQFNSQAEPNSAFFYYTENMVLCLEEITKSYAALVITEKEIPGVAIGQFTRNCLIEEIQSSNDIEGVRSTRREISLAIDEQNDPKNMKKIRMWSIVNKYDKLLNLNNIEFNTSDDLRKFYDEFILDEIRNNDPKDIPDGKIFRAGSVDVDSPTGKAIHRGVYPEEKIIRYMNTALAFLHDESIPALIRISAFHYLFGYIHPFYDGNGRTSRFITSYYLSKIFDPLVAIRLSLTIKKSLRVYYKLFEETNAHGNCGDLTPFISGFLWLILKSITRVNDLLLDKKKILKTSAKKLKSIISDDKKYRIYYILLQASLFSQEGISLEELEEVTGLKTRTLRYKISSFPPDHVLVNKSHRAHRYRLNLGILPKE